MARTLPCGGILWTLCRSKLSLKFLLRKNNGSMFSIKIRHFRSFCTLMTYFASKTCRNLSLQNKTESQWQQDGQSNPPVKEWNKMKTRVRSVANDLKVVNNWISSINCRQVTILRLSQLHFNREIQSTRILKIPIIIMTMGKECGEHLGNRERVLRILEKAKSRPLNWIWMGHKTFRVQVRQIISMLRNKILRHCVKAMS